MNHIPPLETRQAIEAAGELTRLRGRITRLELELLVQMDYSAKYADPLPRYMSVYKQWRKDLSKARAALQETP